MNSHCSQTKRYTAYENPQYIYGTNFNIENQSIHTDIVSCSYHSRTLNEEHESDMGTACKSNPRQHRYVPYRGQNKIKSFEKLLASNEDSAMKQEDKITRFLSNRMARLEEMFSRITDLTDSHLSKKCKSEKQAPTLHNPFKSALHDPQLPSLHDPLKSALHDPQVTPLHNQVISAMPDQHSSLLHYPPPTKIEKLKSPENGKMKLEQSSEKRGYQCSIEKLCIQSLEQYAGWLDGLCNQQCGTSTPKEEQKGVLFECEDWSDQDFEGNDSGENSLLQFLFSEEGQIGSDAPISAVPAELQVVQVTTSGKSVSDHEIKELSSICTEIQESNSEVAEFWWDSLDAKQLPTVDEKDSLANCEEFIDLMHDRLFGIASLNRETLHGTTEEYEAWIDKKFADTFYSASQQESCYRDKSVREVDWTPATQSPTQQEQNYSICSAERRAALLHGVTPISAWNPSLDSEGNQFLNSKGNQFLDSEEENCSDCSFGTVTICQQRASSSAMRIPVTVQGMALKAVVDTAAMVTIVSDKVYREWTVKAPHFKAVSLKTAERDLKMDGHIVGPVSLEVGSSTFSVMVHVTPIYEDMLLGLNFLLEHAVDISLRELYLLIRQDHEKVPQEIVKTDRAGHTVSKVTVEKVEQIQAYPTIYGESNHLLDRPNCSSHQVERQRRMNIISIWHQPGFGMPCQPIGSNETGSSSDPSMWFSFHQIELSDPSQSKIQNALLDTIPGLSQTFNAHILEAKVKSTSESYYSLPCWLGIVTKAARQNYVGTHHYDQSKCLVALKVHVRWLREDQQHWPWDPGGQLFNNKWKGEVYSLS